jgi:GTP-binding protein EngB required for normal cell division
MEHNIIVFGETGAGKSSVINMLDGSPNAPVSNGAAAAAVQDICYQRTIGEKTFNVFDTAGFNQGAAGTVSPPEAIKMLHNLCLRDDGISLLVFVMRAPAIPSTAHQIYKIFYEIVCDKKIPIVIVITGLEMDGDMDEWFANNEEAFREQGMTFKGNACITAMNIPVGGRTNAYEESKKKVERLILDHVTKEPLKIHGPSRKSWFADVVGRVAAMLGLKSTASDLRQLLKTCRLTDQAAKQLADEIGGRGNKDWNRP